MLYTIGEMAKQMHVAPSTLRYYDKEGLLPFMERSSGGIRVFKDSDLQSLSVIECLKKAGLSIKEIKIFMDWCAQGDATIDQRLTLMEQRREAVRQEIAKMQDTLNFLEYKCWYYETAKAAGTCAVHDTIQAEDIPQQYRAATKKVKAPE